jgi:signal transduction histidine kinase
MRLVMHRPGDEAEYARSFMSLRQLKLLSIVIPILAVILLEIARFYIVGPVPLSKRILMDVISIIGILIFAAVIWRQLSGMQRSLERQNEELLALHGAGLAVSAELSLDSVLRTVVEQARHLIEAKYGALSVIDSSGHINRFITSGVTPQERAAIGPPPVGHGVLGVVLREGQHLRLHDVARHPRSSGFPPNHPHMRTLLAVPVKCQSPFLGNIYLSEKSDGSDFTERDQRTLERFAVQAAIAIDNAYLHEQAADLAVAEERLRISHEMHDGLAQVLGYVNTKVQAADMYLQRDDREEASAQLRALAESARAAYAEVREGIVGLRTLPGGGKDLAAALGEYIDRWQEQSGIASQLVVDGNLAIPSSVELQLVRIVQEALANVRKHAKASRVRVEIRRRGNLLNATIADDGVGFDPEVRPRTEFPRFGISTMRERAESAGGSLVVDSEQGKGTTIRFELELPEALD